MRHHEHVARNLNRIMHGDPYKTNPSTGMSPAQREDDWGAKKGAMSTTGTQMKKGGAVHGKAAKHRLDRPIKRATGGSIPDPVADDASDEFLDRRASAGLKKGGRAGHYADGGIVKSRSGKSKGGKGKTEVNVIIGSPPGGAPGGGGPAPPMPPPMMPPGPPPPMGGPPPGGPPMPPPGIGGPPGGMPPGGMPMRPPMPPMGRKGGGRVMDASADNGVGREEKSAKARGR